MVKVEEPPLHLSAWGQASDWTGATRPRSEQLLEGNEVQRRKIRAWLDEWQNGTPKKKAILLIGPPGVGKTTVARAVAEDMGWNVIELNASDARNRSRAIRRRAPAVRPIAPCSTTPAHRLRGRSSFSTRSITCRAGSGKSVRNALLERWTSTMTGPFHAFGRLRGKAELLRLLDQTKQPVVLACNEEMGLWGKNSNWRSTRDRFSRHLIKINFVQCARRGPATHCPEGAAEEGVDFEDAAIDALATTNHGDLRALVRDLQSSPRA